mmetsp:Transcript_12762/g.42096  ORF Transcript_12762/g.42096 Transcript_12762/m.42096 type:complete len:333 (-) Transcript_12762:752-1750(-)
MLVRLGENGHLLGRLPRHKAHVLARRLLERETPQGCPRLLFDLLLLLVRPLPTPARPLALLHRALELVVRRDVDDVLVAKLLGFVEELGLHLGEERGEVCRELLRVDRDTKLLPLLAAHVAARDDACLLGDVLGPHLDAHRRTLHLPKGEAPAGRLLRVGVHLDAQARRLAHRLDMRRGGEHRVTLGVRLPYGNHDHLERRERGREAQSKVVAVRHDHPAHHPRRDAPRRLMHQLRLAVCVQVRRPERFREVGPEVVRRPRLQSLAVTHHSLDGVCTVGARERLDARLAPGHHWNTGNLLRKLCVHANHPHRLLLSLLSRRVRRVPLLPQKL